MYANRQNIDWTSSIIDDQSGHQKSLELQIAESSVSAVPRNVVQNISCLWGICVTIFRRAGPSAACIQTATGSGNWKQGLLVGIVAEVPCTITSVSHLMAFDFDYTQITARCCTMAASANYT